MQVRLNKYRDYVRTSFWLIFSSGLLLHPIASYIYYLFQDSHFEVGGEWLLQPNQLIFIPLILYIAGEAKI